jgi:hypothetical protein
MDKDTAMSQRLGFIGALLRQDINVRLLCFLVAIENSDLFLQNGHRALHPLIMKVGIPAETLKEWSDKAESGGYTI